MLPEGPAIDYEKHSSNLSNSTTPQDGPLQKLAQEQKRKEGKTQAVAMAGEQSRRERELALCREITHSLCEGWNPFYEPNKQETDQAKASLLHPTATLKASKVDDTTLGVWQLHCDV